MTAPGDRGRARRWDPVWRCSVRPARVLAVVAALALLLVAIAPALLEGYARWLIRRDPPVQSDVAIVLGGGEGERLGAAVGIWRQHRVRSILITDPGTPLLPVYTGVDTLTMGEVKRRIAIRKGVPEGDVWLLEGAQSTIDEAVISRSFLEKRGIRSATIVTSPFHTRRARATFQRIYRGSQIRLSVETLPLEQSEDQVTRWWTREHEMMSVFTESVKLLYYWEHYGIPPA